MGGKSGGGGAQTQVVDYRLSIHQGFCWGPVDAVLGINIGDKPVEFASTENEEINIYLSDLFGGPKQGGGVDGSVHVLLGDDDQMIPASLAAKLERTPSTMPGYRGLFSLWFTAANNALSGFRWGSNNPVVPVTKATVRRMPKGLPGDPAVGPDANIAHMIYECVTNTDWGLGKSGGLIDLQSFVDAAETLLAEEIGVSMKWTASVRMEDFIESLTAYANSHFFFDPVIGKWRFVLVRADYDVAALPVITPASGRMIRFDRSNWGETINEVQVSWTDPRSEQVETIRVQDLGNIQIQGGSIVTDTKSYEGVRNPELALRLGLRDLQAASAPLARAEMELDRRFWSLNPGSCVRLQWPSENMQDRVFRVFKVTRQRTSEKITVSLVEDIFSSPYYQIAAPADLWVDPSTIPRPVYRYYLGAVPFYLLAQTLGDTAAQAMEFPATLVMTLADADRADVRQIDYMTEEVLPSGTEEFIERGSFDPQNVVYTAEALVEETTSIIDMPVGTVATLIQVNSFLIFYDEDDPEISETALVTSKDDANDRVTVMRGVLDTVPLIWPTGTATWVLRPNTRFIDRAERIIAVEEQYKFLPVTSKGRLSINDATTFLVTPGTRSYQPYRPAYPRINGSVSRVVSVDSGDTSFIVAWYRRNRLTETAAVLQWDDLDMLPEAGQTTTVRVLDDVGDEVLEITGITGVNTEIDLADIGSPAPGAEFTVEIFSVRDGYESRTRTTIGLLIIA